MITAQQRRIAAERAEQIRLGLQQTALLYATAITEEDWRILGYPNVTKWRDGEFGPDRFSKDRRKEIHILLHDAGQTLRQIADATGVRHPTVMRDLREHGVDGTPSPDPTGAPLPPPPPPNPRQQAARDREHRRRGGQGAGNPPPFRSAARLAGDITTTINDVVTPGGDLARQLAALEAALTTATADDTGTVTAALTRLADFATIHHDRILGLAGRIRAS